MFACQKEADIQKSEETVYEQVGKLHNEGLAYAFDKIKAQATTRTGGKDVTSENLMNYVNEFLISKGENAAGNVILPAIIFSETRSGSTLEGVELSPVENAYFNRLINVGAASSDKSQMINALISLESEVKGDKNATEVEKDNLLYMFVVCRYSTEYWSENLEAWIALLKGSEYAQTRGFWGDLWQAVKEVAVMDGAGALAGSVVPGAGTAAGALGTSLIYCATEVVKDI